LVRRIVLAAAAVAALTGAVVTEAAGQDTFAQNWAQVNVCGPGQLGARAQLAGDGSTDAMQVRFSAQWLNGGAWVPVAGASSPWVSAGTAEYTWQQAGWTFQMTSPPPGVSWSFRVVAELQLGGGRTETHTAGGCTVSG
jgi:hypothetical protein